MACDPRTGALDVLRAVLLVLAPWRRWPAPCGPWCAAAAARCCWAAALALMLVMAAGRRGRGDDARRTRCRASSGLAAERSGGSVAVDLSLTGEALLLLDFGSADRLPLVGVGDGPARVSRAWPAASARATCSARGGTG